MFTLQAPYPAIQTTSLLPNPKFSDTEALTETLQLKIAMNGTLRTYIKTKGVREKLQWNFRLTRNKALEVQAFMRSYHASKVKVTDHNDRVWIGNFTNNPVELDTVSRAAPAVQTLPRGEYVEFTLEFEGVVQ